ncbi:hypothetical protein HDU93_007076 [Gonapodya sp. JEL0774]|nr:hypothetical protein HDU93_007076 [Gonapodya sp. JEL0774]
MDLLKVVGEKLTKHNRHSEYWTTTDLTAFTTTTTIPAFTPVPRAVASAADDEPPAPIVAGTATITTHPHRGLDDRVSKALIIAINEALNNQMGDVANWTAKDIWD